MGVVTFEGVETLVISRGTGDDTSAVVKPFEVMNDPVMGLPRASFASLETWIL